jgi:DNA (cytosine-5)-methyltransferase 1
MVGTDTGVTLSVVGLFAGIGGFELGLSRAGHGTELLCELDPGAQAVLREQFPRVPLKNDVLELKALPSVDVLTAGFPCQDLSQAGATAGITGKQSRLVEHVLTLLKAGPVPKWVLLENVSFMLHLHRGAAMEYLTKRLGKLGFTWAYRVVDTRAFGLPQRRKRVLMLASMTRDPRPLLLGCDAGEPNVSLEPGVACGFYWTEGYRGLGWAIDAVPTLKGGSTIGIPSQPAIWMPNGDIALPEIRDGERLQGFPAGWTSQCAVIGSRARGHRWKLVGNAVSVPVAEWIGRRLVTDSPAYLTNADHILQPGERWPAAAWGSGNVAYASAQSSWPVQLEQQRLVDFLEHPMSLLSARATAGFLARAENGPLRFAPGFLKAVREHLERMRAIRPAA